MSAIVAKPWRDNEGIKGKRKVRDMKTIARCIDMRGAIASRVAAVALSALLAFALLGISLFADLAGATEAKAAEVPVAASTQPIEGGDAPQAAPSASPQSEADAAEETVSDDGTPMGAFDEPKCSTHWAMLIGIIVTAIYAIAVVRHRLSMAEDIDDFENHVLNRSENTDAVSVPTASHQAP